MKKVLVTGAGGFIGGHLVKSLLHDGLEVISVDSKQLENWYQVHSESQNLVIDLKDYQACLGVTRRVDTVYNCAANMGGIKFIEENKTNCMLNSLINTHLLMAARENDVKRYFFASSACVYPQSLQSSPNVKALKEEDAYPAMPEDGYGWEKLFSERMCKHFFEDFGLQTKIARFHNIYGPHGTWFGGREKAPAAICRKIAIAKLSNQKSIEIWGDGKQTRSFTFIEDCVKGIKDIVGSSLIDPVNLGSSFLVSINELVEMVKEIAGISLITKYNLNGPQGVMGRNSDNTKFRSTFGWEPNFPLSQGLEITYKWIYESIQSNHSQKQLYV